MAHNNSRRKASNLTLNTKKNCLSNNLDVCPECQNHVSDDDKGICCEKCLQWWHSTCAKINSSEYDLLTKHVNGSFFLKPTQAWNPTFTDFDNFWQSGSFYDENKKI